MFVTLSFIINIKLAYTMINLAYVTSMRLYNTIRTD